MTRIIFSIVTVVAVLAVAFATSVSGVLAQSHAAGAAKPFCG